jgi:hypothetical protein
MWTLWAGLSVPSLLNCLGLARRVERRSRTGSRADGTTFIASGGASGSRMDREVEEQPLSVLAEAWDSSSRHRPGQVLADLTPAGEGRSDGGVLHLHPQGQARYPEGGRRREDEPPGNG